MGLCPQGSQTQSGVSDVHLLSATTSSTLPCSRLVLVRSVHPTGHLPSVTPGWCRSAHNSSEIWKAPTPSSLPFPVSPTISFTGSATNPTAACRTTPGQFSAAANCHLGLDGFQGFFCRDDGLFNGVILPNFHDALSMGVLFHSLDNPLHSVPCVMSLKGPYDPLS